MWTRKTRYRAEASAAAAPAVVPHRQPMHFLRFSNIETEVLSACGFHNIHVASDLSTIQLLYDERQDRPEIVGIMSESAPGVVPVVSLSEYSSTRITLSAAIISSNRIAQLRNVSIFVTILFS